MLTRYGVSTLKMTHRVWGTYQRYHRAVDPILSFSGSFALIVGWDCAGVALAAKSVALYATIAGVSGTMLGFAITAMALLLGLFPQQEFDLLRKNKDYGAVFTDPKLAIVALATTTLVALGATLASAAESYHFLVLSVVVGLVGWSSVTLIHAARILWLAIATHIHSEQDF